MRPPQAVTASLAPGGSAFDEAVELNATRGDGSVDRSKVSPTAWSFGPARRIHVHAPSSSSQSALGAGDFSIRHGERWIAVEYRAGKPFSTVEVDGEGRFVALDGWLPRDVAALDALTPYTEVLWAGDELYALAPDHARITPMNPEGRAVVGTAPVSAQAFRALKREQRAAAVAERPTGLPADALGGPVAPTGPGRDGARVLPFAVAGFGALLTAGAAYALGLTRRRRPRAGGVTRADRRGDQG